MRKPAKRGSPMVVDLESFRRPPMGVKIGGQTFELRPNTLENFKRAAERQHALSALEPTDENLPKVYELTVDLLSFLCPDAPPAMLAELEGPQIKALIDAWTNQTVEEVLADDAEAKAIIESPTLPG